MHLYKAENRAVFLSLLKADMMEIRGFYRTVTSRYLIHKHSYGREILSHFQLCCNNKLKMKICDTESCELTSSKSLNLLVLAMIIRVLCD